MPLSDDALPENSHIVHPAFLEKHSSKKDLVRRLRKLSQVLEEDESIEDDSHEWPGLAATASILVDKFLSHKDKEVRLYAVLSCMEIFAIYAPHAPWDEEEILKIFRQTIQQLANLGHTTAATQANFANYSRILDLLAHVRIGTVLVELAQNEPDDSDEHPLEVLVDLLHTLLHAVRNEHPPEILDMVVTTIRVCLDEYNYKVPTKILDEILLCIGQGSTMTVLQASKTSKTPLQKQVSNPSYMAAASIIRQTHNKTATPIATLLNGLLNGDTHIVEQSSLHVDHTVQEGSVWIIIYQLHKVAPQILTTVIGTVSNGLESTQANRRLAVTQLLGKLFATPNMASHFHPCFHLWLGRQHDIEVPIRKCMVSALVKMIPVVQNEMQQEAVDALKHLTTTDPNVDVRTDAIHQICDLVYRHRETQQIPAALIQAVGARVSAKHKQERRDALTGLAKIYHRHFVLAKLKDVQAGGDDCDLKVILRVLHDACHLDRRRRRRGGRRPAHEDEEHLDMDEEKYRWIPRKVLESACFTDQADTEMRSRVVHIVDEILLGSSTRSDKSMTATTRAVGLAMIMDSLREDGENLLVDGGSSNALKFLQQLLGQRASLQKTVGSYIDARAKVRQCEPGTEEALAADGEAMELLEVLASLTAPVLDSKVSQADVLQAFHSARDKHIFRILATVANPAHTMQARARALDELPKRTKSLGDAVSSWVKNLVRRCAMGDFMNVDTVSHCVLLAQECFFENDIPACASLLACVKTASAIFPALCGTKKTFVTLTELFSECRSVSDSEKKKDIEESGIVTALSSILSAAAPTTAASSKNKDVATYFSEDDFQAQLFQLSTRDGTPEQARNAVYTLARLLQPAGREASSTVEVEAFDPLLKALTSATRLSISGSRKESSKVVSALSALAAFADCAPRVFNASDRRDKAVKFALETILMGRGHTDEETDAESSDDEEQEGISPSLSGKTKQRSTSKNKDSLKHLSPEGTASLLEDENLSIACRRVCAAIDFLVSHVRASILSSLQKGRDDSSSGTSAPPSEQLRQIFELLTQILRDKGLPPSNRDRRACKSRQDRAALRQCAAVHMLRLCDARLGLEKHMLSPAMWHIFSESLLDEERTVRETVMEELSLFLKGSGVYGIEGSKVAARAPSLRFVALLALCTDGDHGMDQDPANGNAANVGKLSNPTKAAALQCIMNLRKTCDAAYTQCKAMGRNSEKKFDSQFKLLLMPEYVVPFAIHLLSHRRETPSAGATPATEMSGSDGDDNDDSSFAVSDESLHRILRKRLKWLFEPLVQSLGDGADNISFLLRMTEILGKHYKPVDVSHGLTQDKGSPLRLSIDSDSGFKPKIAHDDGKRSETLEAKLKTVCVAAREVLLSFVKKDVNLSTYPGVIQLPSSLFKKKISSSKRLTSKASRHSHPVGSSQSSEETLLSQKQPKSLVGKRKSPQSSQHSMDSTSPMDETSPKRKILRSSQTSSQQSMDSLSQPSIEETSPVLKVTPKRKSLRSTRSISQQGKDSQSQESVSAASGSSEKKESLHSSPSPLQQSKGSKSPVARASAMKKSLGSNQKSRVHFSPDVFGNFSPVARGSVDTGTLGSTPPSTLRGATIHSEAHEGSTDGESPGTNNSSPILKEDTPKSTPNSPDDGFGHEDDDGIKTTSETQSTQENEQVLLSRRSLRKRKTRSQESMESESKEQDSKRKSEVPTQIKINRPRVAPRASAIEPMPKKKRRSSQSDNLDFDFPDDEENQPAGRNRRKKATKKGKDAVKKTKATGKNPVSKPQGKTSSRPLRSRRA